MVFENLTLFELHFEDASFGPTFSDSAADEPETATAAAADGDEASEDGPSVKRLLVASVVFSLVVALLARKLAGDEELPDVAIDAIEEADVDVSGDA